MKITSSKASSLNRRQEDRDRLGSEVRLMISEWGRSLRSVGNSAVRSEDTGGRCLSWIVLGRTITISPPSIWDVFAHLSSLVSLFWARPLAVVDLGVWSKADMDVAGSSSSKLPYRKLSVVLREEQEEESEDLSLVPDDDDDSWGRGFFLKRGGGASDFPIWEETEQLAFTQMHVVWVSGYLVPSIQDSKINALYLKSQF